jgi:hypothetical protein
MPSIDVSDRLYRTLNERAEDSDIEHVVWGALAKTRESQAER